MAITLSNRKKFSNRTIGRQKGYNCYDWIEQAQCRHLNSITTNPIQGERCCTLWNCRKRRSPSRNWRCHHPSILGSYRPLELQEMQIPNSKLEMSPSLNFGLIQAFGIGRAIDAKPKVRMGTKNPCQNIAFVQSGLDGTWNPYHQVY
ncbi:uncharacterized protein [Pyrus communis]